MKLLLLPMNLNFDDYDLCVGINLIFYQVYIKNVII